jgi:hypothetical protein
MQFSGRENDNGVIVLRPIKKPGCLLGWLTRLGPRARRAVIAALWFGAGVIVGALWSG